jgi:hypothetical protein
MTFTNLETATLAAIRNNSEEESGWGAMLEDIVSETGESAKVLRGVISSLIQKNAVYIQEGEFDAPDLYAEV